MSNTLQRIEDLEREMVKWTPKAREEAWKQIKNLTSGERVVWYCIDDGSGVHGRNCDGEPHGDYLYRHARADQWPPKGTSWLTWLATSGRGAGKTRSGSEWTRAISGKVAQTALIGRRGTDVRATMIEGMESGLIKACENAGMSYEWLPSKKEFTFGNGAKVFGYSAEEPDSLRGREHGAAWVDEPCHMPLIDEVWSNLEFTLRQIGMPGGAKIYCTSTPLPLKWLKALIKMKSTRHVTVSTYANLKNLDPGMRARILDKYQGTRKGRQEINGEILEDVEGSLWKDEMIERSEFTSDEIRELCDRILVAIDPAGTANRRSDETGIVVVGKIGQRFYVLEDLSGKYSPQGWATAADKAYRRWKADAILAEKNYGGDMVKQNIETFSDARVIVTTASRSKELRAEPVVGKYEKKAADGFPMVLHNGKFVDLETEMVTWVPGKGASPNRIDALVWGILELMGEAGPATMAVPHGNMRSSVMGQRSNSPQLGRSLSLPGSMQIRR